MNFKTVASAAGVVTLLFGLAFLLAPVQTLAIYGSKSADPMLVLMTRYFGSAFVAFAGLAWGMRGIENADVQRIIGKLTAVSTLVGALVSVQAATSGAMNAMAWSSVAIYLIFAALWGRIGFMR